MRPRGIVWFAGVDGQAGRALYSTQHGKVVRTVGLDCLPEPQFIAVVAPSIVLDPQYLYRRIEARHVAEHHYLPN